MLGSVNKLGSECKSVLAYKSDEGCMSAPVKVSLYMYRSEVVPELGSG